MTPTSRTSTPDGQWAIEFSGPMFIPPAFIIVLVVTNTPTTSSWKTEIQRYLAAPANPDDGGGSHIEGKSTVFGTACNYAVLRILGVNPDHHVRRACRALHKFESALGREGHAGINGLL